MTEETCGDKRCGRRAAGSFQLGKKKEIILHDMTLTHLAYFVLLHLHHIRKMLFSNEA